MRPKRRLSPQQERMQHTRYIYHSLIDRIFADKKEARTKALYLIAQENQKLLNCQTPTFMFDGHWCPIAWTRAHQSWNRELHPSLRERVSQIFYYTDFDDLDIQAGIQSLIANALAMAKDAGDITRLLPQQITNNLVHVDPEIFNSGSPLSESEVLEFHETNKNNLAYLKRMLITQLLMAKK